MFVQKHETHIAHIGIEPWAMFEARREAESGVIAWLLGHTPSAFATAVNYGLARREIEYDDARAIHSACIRTWAKHPRDIADACIRELEAVHCWTWEPYSPDTIASMTWNVAKLAKMFHPRFEDIEQIPDWPNDTVYGAVSEGMEASILLLRAVCRDVGRIESALRYARETAARWNHDQSRWPVLGVA